MHTRKIFGIVASVAFIQLLPSLANAQVNSGIERQKAHVVSRMYQATYGAQERCCPSKEASVGLAKAIEQLRAVVPELMSLIDGSPYLPQAKEQFKAFLSSTPTAQDNQALVQECAGIEYILRQFAETSGGREAANDMIQTLKK